MQDAGFENAARTTLRSVLPAFAAAWLVSIVVAPDLARWLVREDRVVEWLQFALLAVAAALIARAAYLNPAPQRRRLLAVAVLVAFVAAEEINWGQRVFGFETPEVVRRASAQEQLSIHNLNPLQRFRHWGLIALGLAGLAALRARTAGQAEPIPSDASALPAYTGRALALAVVSGLARELGVLWATVSSGTWAKRADFWSGRFTEIGELAVALVALVFAARTLRFNSDSER